jgi:UDP-N-acetylglucosamine--N-acetylmuramyl-(pentapeptide) pyrophosphoryl-undecaprenol N-acetylglucosamine transferase
MLTQPHAALLRAPAKIWLCGGGTGGHVYPALAVATALHGRADHADPAPAGLTVAYVGSSDGMEASLVPRESQLPYRAIPAAALRGRSPLTLARNSLTLLRGAWAARRLLARERPDAILGTGGYVCVPVFLAARSLGIPTAIYLPDVVPGLAVRFLARIASAVACSVEDSAPYFGYKRDERRATYDEHAVMAGGNIQPDMPTSSPLAPRPRSVVVTGYPVRPELYRLDRRACRQAFGLEPDLPAVLVYGGSRGARSINMAVAALLAHILPIAQVIHVCGREGDEQFLREAAGALPAGLQARYRLYPYLHSESTPAGPHGEPGAATAAAPLSMAGAFGAADLAICRSGASTLGELPAAGLPAVLVPYPFVHQEENADYLVRHGAAYKVGDSDMLGAGRPDEGPLFRQLQRLIGEPHERASMAQRSRQLARPDAAHQLAGLLLALAARRTAA